MDIKPCHKALAEYLVKVFNLVFVKDMNEKDSENLKCNDTDSVIYYIEGKNKSVTLYVSCIDLRKLWEYGQKQIISKYYRQIPIKLTQYKGQEMLALLIDNQTLTVLMNNFKPQKQQGIVTGKKKFDALFRVLSKRLACIKRHLFATPFEIMLEAVQKNCQNYQNVKVQNFCFFTKPERKQKIWLAFEKTQFSVYYGVSFQDRFEQQLAKIYFSQLVDAKKHVQNAPHVSVSQSQISQFLINAFPSEKKQTYPFTNGIGNISYFGKNRTQYQYDGKLASQFQKLQLLSHSGFKMLFTLKSAQKDKPFTPGLNLIPATGRQRKMIFWKFIRMIYLFLQVNYEIQQFHCKNYLGFLILTLQYFRNQTGMAYIQKLQELNKLIKDEISMIEKGAKLSTFKRDEKPKEKQLKKELLEIIKSIATTSDFDNDMWIEIRNYITILIRETLDQFNEKYKDSKTFEEQKEVILQYMVYFDKPPFTLQRICELTLNPEKYYKSCRKILYAYEKLVNVSDPDER